MLPLLVLSAAAEAATLRVCAACTYTTVADAVAAASAGDTIRVGAGTWNEAVTLDKDLTLEGAGSATTLLTANSNPLVNIQTGVHARIEGFTLAPTGNLRAIYGSGADITLVDVAIEGVTGNLAGQCVRIIQSTLTIADSSFVDCDGGSEGGALHLTDSTLDVTDTVFAENQASNTGAAIYATGTDVTLSGCSFSANRTDVQGGAVGVLSGRLTVTGSTFVNNQSGNGGAVYADDGITLDSSTFEGNHANAGGGLYLDDGDLDLSTSSFAANRALDEGGGVSVHGSGDVSVRSCTFTGNLAGSGAGFGSTSSGRQLLVFEGNLFDSNRANDFGGGLYVHNGIDKVLSLNRFIANEADRGGAVSFDNGDTSSSTGDWFCDNTSTTYGGAVHVASETDGSWTGSLFVENVSADGGGLALISSDGALVNVDAIGNSASNRGGGVFVTGDLTVTDSLVAFTADGDGVHADGALDITWSDLYEDVPNPLAGTVTTVPATNMEVDPQLMAWVPGDGCDGDFRRDPSSPLVDGGNPAETDPDGSVRDIGAFGPVTDEDADGYLMDDCDNNDASVHPGATETCDGRDEDCNGIFDDGLAATSFHADRDDDGFGSPTDVADACVVPAGYTTDATDCDDTDRNVAPGATESCDGIDEDCDSAIDDGAWDAPVWHVDADGDGFGDEADLGVRACADANGNGPAGRLADASDCDDSTATISPVDLEMCNNLDDNCDNLTDNDPQDGVMLYQDADHDGYGNRLINKKGCPDDVVPGWVTDYRDCDDHDDTIGPSTRWYDNDDGDAWGDDNQFDTKCVAPEGFIDVGGDCDDQDPTIGAAHSWYVDVDGDGYGVGDSIAEQCDAPPGAAGEVGDCDDADAARNPGAEDIPDDTIDQDCDGADAIAVDTDLPPGDSDTDTGGDGGCKGCATGGHPYGLAWLGIGLLALRRRR